MRTQAASFLLLRQCGIILIVCQRDSLFVTNTILVVLICAVSSVAYFPQSILYDSEPSNVWNLLHAALFIRHYRDQAFGADELDPLLWRNSNYLSERS